MSASKKEPAADDAGKKKPKKLLIMVALAVVLLAAGGGGYYMFFSSPSGDSKEAAAPKPGQVVPLSAVTVNLAEGHYLKLKLALQMTADAGEDEPDGSKALDIAIEQFTGVELAELSSTPARQKAKKELLDKISEAYEKKVMDIYFVEFVMQ